MLGSVLCNSEYFFEVYGYSSASAIPIVEDGYTLTRNWVVCLKKSKLFRVAVSEGLENNVALLTFKEGKWVDAKLSLDEIQEIIKS